MQNKLDLAQLRGKTAVELNAVMADVMSRHKELSSLKSKGSKEWTKALQEELDDLTLFIVDLTDLIAMTEQHEKYKAFIQVNEEAIKKSSYIVSPGTENMVHLELMKGHKFDPNTGKEISKTFVQIFSYNEYQIFLKHHVSLGYKIINELYNPFKK